MSSSSNQQSDERKSHPSFLHSRVPGTGMSTSTPFALWHGGGQENGKADPVFSVDFHPSDVFATGGIDANTPPKGSVRLWTLGSALSGGAFDCLLDLTDHQCAVNVVRFSPCGKKLASASERAIVIYSVSDPSRWQHMNEVSQLNSGRTFLRTQLNDEIYDLQWSPDSSCLILGSIDTRVEVIRLTEGNQVAASEVLRGHSSYVQGVAWDPCNKVLATQSADKRVVIHQLRKYALGEKVSVKQSYQTKASYAMSTLVQSFFRRLSFSPDGNLLVTPTGTFKPSPLDKETFSHIENLEPSFCTHIFTREQFATPAMSPAVSLVGLEEPSVAVKFSPVLYRPTACDSSTSSDQLFPGRYRMIFAVATVSSVLVYDTQHVHPIAKLGGFHFASINDIAWSANGNNLVFCSSDGYVSFVTFENGALGEPLPASEVPTVVKRTHPLIYGYVPPQTEDKAATSASDKIVDISREEEDEEEEESVDRGSCSEDISPSRDVNSSINSSSDSIRRMDFTPMDIDTPLAESTTPADSGEVGLSISKISGDILGSTGTSACTKKRRITPLLVTSSAAATPVAATAVAAVESAPIIIPSIGEAPSPLVVELHQRKQHEEGKHKNKKRVTLQHLGPLQAQTLETPPMGNAQ